MKKLLSLTMTVIMVCMAVFAFASCGKDATPIPEGYVKYDNGDIYFGYPEDWRKSSGSVVTLTNSSGTGNNITVVNEEKTEEQKSYDLDFFNENMKPAYELMGMKISNAAVEQTTNENGIEITKITYTVTVKSNGTKMDQTQFIANGSDYTYIITVTEVTQDDILVSNVFETLNLSK